MPALISLCTGACACAAGVKEALQTLRIILSTLPPMGDLLIILGKGRQQVHTSLASCVQDTDAARGVRAPQGRT